MSTSRALGRNIMVFASEVPVISALNPYRKIEDVFLDVWRRTNPRQVSSLQEQLSMALPSPEEKMQSIVEDLGVAPAITELIREASEADTVQQVAKAQAKVVQLLPFTTPTDVKAHVVQFVTSTMHKCFGIKHETAGIEQYQEKRKVMVKERNLVFSKKKVATVGKYNLLVGGKIDGRADGKVIEVKNRLKKFLEPLPKYDIAQLQTYLYILGVQEGELVEHLHMDKAQTKMTKVARDDKMWNAEIEPYLVRFGSALTHLMKDKTVQSDYLQSDPGQQREIIRYLWSQEVDTSSWVDMNSGWCNGRIKLKAGTTTTGMADGKELRETVHAAFSCYDEDDNGWIDTAELRHLISDLGGVLTERDFRKALRILDRDNNGVIDRDEFTEWWVGQTAGNEAAGEVKKMLARLKDLGRQRFRVDIHTACWNGFEDVVERLAEDGSELVNKRDTSEYGNQNSPLHYAAYQGHTSICDILIKRGASINGTNGSGCTAVFFAAQQGHVEVVKLLLQNGAELRIAESKNGLTPVDVCTTSAITDLFRNLSGKPPSIPAAPTLEPLSDKELKIVWSPSRPNLDEVVPVSGYKIKLSSPSAPSKVVLAVAFPTETSIGGLCADTEYSASICAISLHGLSEFSPDSDPARTRRSKPSAPVLCVTDTGPAELTVMWALADNDRQPGVSCVIYLSSPEPDGTCSWESVFKTDDHTINSTTVKKLLPDHRYKLRAVVTSDDGQQTFSDAIAARTAGKASARRSTSSKVVGAVNVMRAFGTHNTCPMRFDSSLTNSRKDAKDKREPKHSRRCE